MLQNKLNNYLIIYLAIIPVVAIITLKYFNFYAPSLTAAYAFLLFILLMISNRNIKLEKYIIFYILFFVYQTFVDSFKVPDYSFNVKQFYLNDYLVPIFVFLVIEIFKANINICCYCHYLSSINKCQLFSKHGLYYARIYL